MTPRTEDDRLWELHRVETYDDGPAPDETVLVAYRNGVLSDSETTRVEWRLAGSRRGRARLAELAGIRLDAPAAPSAPRFRLVAAVLATAATVAIAALLVAGRGWLPGVAPRPIPEFSVRAEGLAATRGTAGTARALASGRVRVVVEPQGDAASGLTFAAYRLDAQGLTLLSEPGDVTITEVRGSAAMTATAAALIGPSPGTRPFYVVVARGDRLPARVSAADASALAGATGGRVYAVTLTIVEQTENAP